MYSDNEISENLNGNAQTDIVKITIEKSLEIRKGKYQR